MEKAWDVKTLAGFRWTEVIWLEYVRLHHLYDPYLSECSVSQATRWVMGFIVYLEDVMFFTGPQIVKSLTNLRGIIIIYGGCEVLFSSEAMKVARRSIRNIHASLFAPSILLEETKKPVVQLPICVEFMDRFREWYWHEGTVTEKMIYIASMVAFLRGLRISNVASTGPKSKDHRYYLRSVDLEIEQGIVTVRTWKDLGSPPVLSVKLTCVSSKTHGPSHPSKKTVPPIVMIADVGSRHEQLLMSDLVTWLNISGMQESNDLLFARWDRVHNHKAPSYKQLQSKDVSTALKRIASSFDMDPNQFSTRSIRIGSNVELSVQGVTDGQRMSCLGHVTLSSNVKYMRSLVTDDPNPLSEEGQLSMSGVKKMARFL